jgi:DNA-binding transcriptional LysR family regulator
MQLDASILGSLRCFEMAGRLLSFTETARALHLTQSAVSQQIRNLEERLGYSLFLRQSRGLMLTPKGEALWKVTSKVFLELNRTLHQLSASNVPLQISCSPSFALQWLMPRLADFHYQHSYVSLRLSAEFHSIDWRVMESDRIDVALRYDPFEYDRLNANVILDEYLVAVATPKYVAQHRFLTAGQSLDGVVLLYDSAAWVGAPELVEVRAWLDGMDLTCSERWEGRQYNLASLAVGAALNHQGIAVSRTALVCEELKNGRLVNVFRKHVLAPARYVLLCSQPDDERVVAFSEWLRRECELFDKIRMQVLQA